MSEEEGKTVIRLSLPELTGMDYNQVFPYFVERLGIPTDIDEFDGKVEYFSYRIKASTEKRHRSKEIAIEYYRPVKNEDKWGVDLVLNEGYVEEWQGLNLSIVELMAKATVMADKFGKKMSDCRVAAYSWYNGCDEPISFGE